MTLRAYLAPEQWTESSLELPYEEAHHLQSVRRASVGDVVEVMDGRGRIAQGRLVKLAKRSAILELEGLVSHAPPEHPMALAAAMMNGTRWDWMLQKATELGLSALFPLITARTQERKTPRLDRWQAICVAAIKQSGNPWLPTLHETQTLQAFIQHRGESDLILMGDQRAGASPWTRKLAELQPGASILCVTGPEGGFSEEEQLFLREQGALGVSLGRHTLRAETAAISFLAGISMTLQPT